MISFSSQLAFKTKTDIGEKLVLVAYVAHERQSQRYSLRPGVEVGQHCCINDIESFTITQDLMYNVDEKWNEYRYLFLRHLPCIV